jgi:hypothetical protein
MTRTRRLRRSEMAARAVEARVTRCAVSASPRRRIDRMRRSEERAFS